MRSQACSPRKERTEPAVLNMKPTIEPIKPGSAAAAFLPSSLSPLPIALVAFARPFRVESTTALMVLPAARTTACRVEPYFLKIARILSRKGLCLSRTSISSVSISNSSFLTASLSLAASLSLGEVVSSSTIRRSSVTC